MSSSAGTLVFVPSRSERGQELLDRFVRPLAARRRFDLVLPPGDAERGFFGKTARHADRVVFDGTVEEGHPYGLLYPSLLSLYDSIALVSRTPPPKNLDCLVAIAPTLGNALTNEQIADRLDRWLGAEVAAPIRVGAVQAGYRAQAARAQRVRESIGVFVSHRGHDREAALRCGAKLGAEWSVPHRVIPKGEYAESRECLTPQTIWAILARFEEEIKYAEGIVVLESEEYARSFWTMSELYIALHYRSKAGRDPRHEVRVAVGESGSLSDPVALGMCDPDPAAQEKYRELIREGDVKTGAPERFRPRHGLQGALASLLYRTQGYTQDEAWWQTLMVPCGSEGCNPGLARLEDVDWSRHFDLKAYGYFGVDRPTPGDRETLVECPRCRRRLRLRATGRTRHLLVPGPLFRSWEGIDDLLRPEPVIEALPVDGGRGEG